MVAKNVLRQVGHVVYRLKRQYGLLMYIRYRQAADQYNLETGAITRDITSIKVRRGILLPERITRDFAYDLSFIAANKNFTYGGIYDINQREIIIDAKDLGSFNLSIQTILTFSGSDYDIKELMWFEDNLAVKLIAVELKGT